MGHAPRFWSKAASWQSYLLTPIAYFFRGLTMFREKCSRPYKCSIPVMCVGNAVMGGAGKTPATIAVARMLKEKGYNVVCLSRGYKGTLKGPLQVDPIQHTYDQVGDEPLLLATILPTWIAKNRVQGLRALEKLNPDMIICDDGLQNPTFHKDFTVLIVDGSQKFGNKKIFPAGPLRAPLSSTFSKSNCVILVNPKVTSFLPKTQLNIFTARLMPLPGVSPLQDKSYIAFCGIGSPRKFIHTLKETGYDVVKSVTFPDHYSYTDTDLKNLVSLANAYKCELITTTKDYVRLPRGHQQVHVLPINMHISEEFLPYLLSNLKLRWNMK